MAQILCIFGHPHLWDVLLLDHGRIGCHVLSETGYFASCLPDRYSFATMCYCYTPFDIPNCDRQCDQRRLPHRTTSARSVVFTSAISPEGCCIVCVFNRHNVSYDVTHDLRCQRLISLQCLRR